MRFLYGFAFRMPAMPSTAIRYFRDDAARRQLQVTFVTGRRYVYDECRRTYSLRSARLFQRAHSSIMKFPTATNIAKSGTSMPTRAFSSEVETGSRQENASNQESRAPLRFYRSGKGSSQWLKR
jgi:hypothetical protein